MSDDQFRPLTYERRRGPQPAQRELLIRPPRPDDQGYVSKSWLAQMAEVDRDYSRGQRWGQAGRHVDLVLGREDTRALIVSPAAAQRTILAWLVYAAGPSVPVVHFVCTRREERGKGFARRLLRELGIQRVTPFVYTCHGPSERTLQSAYPAATYHALWRFLGLPEQYDRPVDGYKPMPPGER